MGTKTGTTLRERREAIVREHMESENRHEFDVTMGTFDHPRYELIATGDVHDGAEAVARVLRREPHGVPRPAQRADRAAPRRRRGDRRVRPARARTTARSAGSRRRAARSRCRMAAFFLFEPRARASSASASTSTPRRSCGSSAWPTIR